LATAFCFVDFSRDSRLRKPSLWRVLRLTPRAAPASCRAAPPFADRYVGGPLWPEQKLNDMTGPVQKSSGQPSGDTAERLVLIVEDDPPLRAAKIRALAACKRVSFLGVSSRDVVDVALEVSPRALLIEATDTGEISAEVHRVLERDYRVSAVILGHERTERARRRYAGVAARFYGVASPIRSEEIEAFVAEPPLAESWAGSFSPGECLRAAGIGGHSLSIECVSPSGARLGSIVMERGTIVAAQTSSHTGFEAFRELVTSAGVRTIMRPPVQVEPQPDLAGDWEFILLEALRLHDQDLRRLPLADDEAHVAEHETRH